MNKSRVYAQAVKYYSSRPMSRRGLAAVRAMSAAMKTDRDAREVERLDLAALYRDQAALDMTSFDFLCGAADRWARTGETENYRALFGRRACAAREKRARDAMALMDEIDADMDKIWEEWGVI